MGKYIFFDKTIVLLYNVRRFPHQMRQTNPDLYQRMFFVSAFVIAYAQKGMVICINITVLL